MDHDHHSDGPRCQAPRVLPNEVLALPANGLRFVLDVEHLGKVLAEAVRGTALHPLARGRDEGLHGGGVQSSRKLFLLGFLSPHHRHGQELLVDLGVEVQDVQDLGVGLRLGSKGGVALLPQELPAPDEGGRVLELPPDHVAPLVQAQRQVAVAPDPVRVEWVHHRLARGADRDGDVQVSLARLGDPRHLRGKVLHVVLLLVQHALRDEKREVAVLHAEGLDLPVEPLVDGVPDAVRPGPEDVATRDLVVADHLALRADLGVPVSELFELPGIQSQLRHLAALALLLLLLGLLLILLLAALSLVSSLFLLLAALGLGHLHLGAISHLTQGLLHRGNGEAGLEPPRGRRKRLPLASVKHVLKKVLHSRRDDDVREGH
mmetsp:Transcript_6675/g.22987  ORF Transcript_6675/g.22987 Transcript_6675/m.22987 type:complete len:376 (-) Transcript_6675:559-1686(-)